MIKRPIRLIIFWLVLILACIGITLWHIGQNVRLANQHTSVHYTYTKNLSPNDRGVLVLAYHLVLDDNIVTQVAQHLPQQENLRQFSVTTDALATHLQTIRNNQIPILTADQLTQHLADNTVPDKAVVLTFDDIDYTVVNNAYPLLVQYDAPAIFFTITGHTGENLGDTRLANWVQLKMLNQDTRMTLGLHTHDLHYQVAGKPVMQLKKLKMHTMIQDYHMSQKMLFKHIHESGQYFAYPYGASNQRMTKYLQQEDIRGIFTLDAGVVNSQTKPTNIPRYIVNESSWPAIEKWLKSK